jgi:hypothetical protein
MRARPATLFVACLLLLAPSLAGAVATPTAASGPRAPASPPDNAPATATGVADGGASAPAVDDAARPDATDAATIEQTTTMSLTPERPGEVDVRLSFDPPTSLTELEVRVPPAASVEAADGFEPTDDRRFAWDGDTDAPTLTFRYAANDTGVGGRTSLDAAAGRSLAPGERRPDAPGGPERDATGRAGDGWTTGDRASHGWTADPRRPLATDSSRGYAFVDTGPWAIVRVPEVGTRWSWRGGDDVDIAVSAAVDGEGATGGEMAYLGPMTEHVREANGQRFRLVVPAAAELSAEPDAVLGALANASGVLAVGARDPSVLFLAAPTSVPWGSAGLTYGGSDAWVLANATLETAGNVWFHEYVHTRQSYQSTDATRWTVEGSAEYYTALLAYRLDYVGFEAFANYLERGENTRYADGVLADARTWEGPVNYLKGGLVFGQLDRRVRLASDGDASADDLLARLNDAEGPVTQSAFLDAVRQSGDDGVARYARRYTETADVPSMWGLSAHREAFQTGRSLAYRIGEADRSVSGPYRDGDLPTDAPVVVGETLTLSVPVTNTGTEPAAYAVSLDRDAESLATAEGRLAPGETATATLTHEVTRAGTLTLVAGPDALVLTAREVAPLRVTDLSVSTERSPVVVTATVAGAADRPAAGDLSLSVDGERRATRAVSVDAGATATATFEVTLPAGGHDLAVGDATRTVDVPAGTTARTETGTTARTETGTTAETTPLSPSTPAVALLLAALLFRRRR